MSTSAIYASNGRVFFTKDLRASGAVESHDSPVEIPLLGTGAGIGSLRRVGARDHSRIRHLSEGYEPLPNDVHHNVVNFVRTRSELDEAVLRWHQ